MKISYHNKAGCQLFTGAVLPNATHIGVACPNGNSGLCATRSVTGSGCKSVDIISINMDCLGSSVNNGTIDLYACWFTIPSVSAFSMHVSWKGIHRTVSKSTDAYSTSCCNNLISFISYNVSAGTFTIDAPPINSNFQNSLITSETNYPTYHIDNDVIFVQNIPNNYLAYDQSLTPNSTFTAATVNTLDILDNDNDNNIHSLNSIPSTVLPASNVSTYPNGYLNITQINPVPDNEKDITSLVGPSELHLSASFLQDLTENSFGNSTVNSLVYFNVDNENNIVISSNVPNMSLEAPPTPEVYTLSGNVISVSGAAMSGVAIVINGSPFIVTDISGNYSTLLQASTYNISARLSSFVFSPSAVNMTLAANTIQNFVGSLRTTPAHPTYTVTDYGYGSFGGTYTYYGSGYLTYYDYSGYGEGSYSVTLDQNSPYNLYSYGSIYMGYSTYIGSWIIVYDGAYMYQPNCGYNYYAGTGDPPIGQWYDPCSGYTADVS